MGNPPGRVRVSFLAPLSRRRAPGGRADPSRRSRSTVGLPQRQTRHALSEEDAKELDATTTDPGIRCRFCHPYGLQRCNYPTECESADV